MEPRKKKGLHDENMEPREEEGGYMVRTGNRRRRRKVTCWEPKKKKGLHMLGTAKKIAKNHKICYIFL